jgi:hypothetical protein
VQAPCRYMDSMGLGLSGRVGPCKLLRLNFPIPEKLDVRDLSVLWRRCRWTFLQCLRRRAERRLS